MNLLATTVGESSYYQVRRPSGRHGAVGDSVFEASENRLIRAATDLGDDHSEWMARLDKVAPVIERHRATTEEQRVTSPEVMDVVREAGFHRMWVSKAFGGARASIAIGSAVIQRLAMLDASIAWQVGVQGAIGRLSDYLPEATAAELFAEQDGLVVGGVNPAGVARPVPGGYVLTGEWSFASGSAHAPWLVCAAMVRDGDQPPAPGEALRIRLLFLPANEVTFTDDWHTIGLRGTGSVSYTVDEVFVADEYTVDGASMHRPPPDRPSLGYPISYYDFGPFTSASTALGVARDAVQAFRTLAAAKTPTAASRTLASSHTVQEKYARMEMLLHSSTLLLAEAADRVTTRGHEGSSDVTALVRLTAATVAEQATAAVDLAYQLAGTSSLYTSSRLERCLRDVRSAVKHITLSHTHFEMVGQYLLGGELLTRR